MIYALKVRMVPDGVFGAFDCPDAGQICPKRTRSTTPIQSLSGIGATRALPYSRLGIRTVRDLLFHFPTRLEEFRPPTPVSELFFQTEGSVVGTLQRLEVENLPAGLKKHRATIRDRTGTIYAEWLRRGVWRLGIRPGEAIAISGTIVASSLKFRSSSFSFAGFSILPNMVRWYSHSM